MKRWAFFIDRLILFELLIDSIFFLQFKNFALSKLKSNVQLVSCLKETSENSGGDSEETPSVPDFGYSTPTGDEDSSPALDPRKPTTTTTTEEPDVPGKKRRPVRGCRLPVQPNEARLAPLINGLRYGARQTGRTEVKLEASKTKELERDAKIEFKFSSTSDSGLLLLLVDNKFIDHTLVYLLRGKLYCSFNLGSGTLLLESDIELSTNGGQWHRVSIVRESKEVKIYVDDKEVKSGTLPGDKTSLNVNPILYVGGLPIGLVESASVKMKENLYGPFEGCINDVKLNSDTYLLDLEESFDGVESCDPEYASSEEGIFFRGKK